MTFEELMKKPELSPDETKKALELASRQTESCLSEFSSQFKSVYSENGFYTPVPNEQWTNGFWTGELWLAYQNTGDERYREAALKQAESFLERIETGNHTDTHDLGFLYSLSCVSGYKLTGNETAKKAALLAADRLKSRFHEKGQFLQAWGAMDNLKNYRLIIDCLLNLPLLYWATEETGQPEYAKKARAHLDTALSVIIRPDYSTYHTYYFDPETGKPLRGVTHQGYSADSVWARGQAWGVYGTAVGYKYTRRAEYIDIFKGVIRYFLEHLPEDLVPFWDLEFGDGDDQPRDSSSASIAACGMLEMAKYMEPDDRDYYTGIAKKLMKSVADHYAVKDPAVSNGQVLHSTYSNHSPYNTCNHCGVDECNSWGDYFYMEALTRLSKNWEQYW